MAKNSRGKPTTDDAADIPASSTPSAASLILLEIEKQYGDGVVVDGKCFAKEEGHIISVSPSMDMILSGGIQEGSWVGITGNPKTSKTNLALCIAAQAQKKENGSRPVYYAKIEGRLSIAHLKGIRGLNLDAPHFNVIQSIPGKILTGQDFLKILTMIITSVPNAVVIIDSISCLCDERESSNGVGTETRGGGAKLFSQFCRTLNQVVPVNKTIVLGITHLISNTSGMGPQYIERAARAWVYQCDYQLRTIQRSDWIIAERKVGYIVKWVCNNSRNGTPGMQMESYVRFGVGLDRSVELLTLAIASGIIKRSGAWLSFVFGGEAIRFQGLEKMAAELESRPELYSYIADKLKDFSAAVESSLATE